MSLKIVLVAVFVIFCVYPVLAQKDLREGYYIAANGDSILGYVEYRVATSTVNEFIYRKKTDGDNIVLNPMNTKAYGFRSGQRYVSKKLPKSQGSLQVFMEHLVKGKMSLYQYNESFFIETDTLIYLPHPEMIQVRTTKGSLMKNSKPYIGILNYYLFDCKLNANKVEYNEKGFTKLINDFNTCKGSPSIIYKENIPFTKIYFKVFAGLDLAKMKVEGLESDFFNKSVSPLIGTTVEFSAPRFSDRTFFDLDFMFSNKKYHGYAESLNPYGVNTRSDYNIDMFFMKIPIGVKINLLGGKQTPYLKVCFVQYFELHSSGERIRETEYSGIVTTETTTLDMVNRNQSGFSIGAGFNKIFQKENAGFVELRFEKLIGQDLLFSDTSTSTFNFIVGYRF